MGVIETLMEASRRPSPSDSSLFLRASVALLIAVDAFTGSADRVDHFQDIGGIEYCFEMMDTSLPDRLKSLFLFLVARALAESPRTRERQEHGRRLFQECTSVMQRCWENAKVYGDCCSSLCFISSLYTLSSVELADELELQCIDCLRRGILLHYGNDEDATEVLVQSTSRHLLVWLIGEHDALQMIQDLDTRRAEGHDSVPPFVTP